MREAGDGRMTSARTNNHVQFSPKIPGSIARARYGYHTSIEMPLF